MSNIQNKKYKDTEGYLKDMINKDLIYFCCIAPILLIERSFVAYTNLLTSNCHKFTFENTRKCFFM